MAAFLGGEVHLDAWAKGNKATPGLRQEFLKALPLFYNILSGFS